MGTIIGTLIVLAIPFVGHFKEIGEDIIKSLTENN